MPVLLNIWVVRHGQTVANVQRIMQGQADGELTELGIVQAKQLARAEAACRSNAAALRSLSSQLSEPQCLTRTPSMWNPAGAAPLQADVRRRLLQRPETDARHGGDDRTRARRAQGSIAVAAPTLRNRASFSSRRQSWVWRLTCHGAGLTGPSSWPAPGERSLRRLGGVPPRAGLHGRGPGAGARRGVRLATAPCAVQTCSLTALHPPPSTPPRSRAGSSRGARTAPPTRRRAPWASTPGSTARRAARAGRTCSPAPTASSAGAPSALSSARARAGRANNRRNPPPRPPWPPPPQGRG